MNSQIVGCAEKQISALPQAAAVSTTERSEKKKKNCAGRVIAAMATIQDDDERLLTRIGYKQVDLTATCGSPWAAENEGLDTHLVVLKGIAKRIYQMVDCIVCGFDSWCVRFGSCNICSPHYFRRAGDSSLVLVFWVLNGHVYSDLR